MDTQSAHIDELYDCDRTTYWHAFTQMAEYEPLVIERADGVWLHDILGRQLLDGASSMWCNVHGHNHPALNGAIEKQLGRVAHATSLGMSCDVTIELAKRLVECTPAWIRACVLLQRWLQRKRSGVEGSVSVFGDNATVHSHRKPST